MAFWFPKKAQHRAEFEDTPHNRAYAERARTALGGFLAHDEAATRALVEMMTPVLYAFIAKHREEWLPLWREIQARCFDSLVVWRHDGRLRADEPVPYLVKRLAKQAIRAIEREEGKQEEVAAGWVLEPRAAAVRADQLTDAKRLIERIWALAAAKMAPSRVAALRAIVLEEEGGPPIEKTLGTSREAASRKVVRARAQIARLAREAGLLDDIPWEGRGDLVMVEIPVDDEEGHG